jgi:hypothetical protein
VSVALPSDSRNEPIPWLRVFSWFFVTRLAIWLLAGASLRFMPKGQFFYEARGPLDWLMRWDAQWYLEVAATGYAFDPTRMSNVNFLPVYPMCARALNWIIGNIDLAAYVVSHTFCLGATALLWQLTRDITRSNTAADGAMAFFLMGPVSVFFASIYSESAFLFFALASILAARKSHWLLAGVCGALAALSRSVGLLLVVPLAIEFWQQNRASGTWRTARTWLRFACCGLPAAGTAGYAIFLGWRFGNPEAYVISQRHGGHGLDYPWRFFWSGGFKSLEPFYKFWFGGAAISGVALTIAGAWLRLPLPLTGFAVAITTLYLATSIEGLPRFFSVVFPFYCALGIVRERWPRASLGLLGVSGALAVLSVALFVNGYWFT